MTSHSAHPPRAWRAIGLGDGVAARFVLAGFLTFGWRWLAPRVLVASGVALVLLLAQDSHAAFGLIFLTSARHRRRVPPQDQPAPRVRGESAFVSSTRVSRYRVSYDAVVERDTDSAVLGESAAVVGSCWRRLTGTAGQPDHDWISD
jgi:hypothetical protein